MRIGAWSAAGAAVLFASAGAAAALAPADVSAAALGATRLLLGGAALALLIGPREVARTLAALPRVPLAAAAFAMALFQWTFFAAVAAAGVGAASLASVGAAPLAADALALARERRRPGLGFAVCALFTGLSLVVLARASSAAAVALSAGSACAYAGYTVATHRLEGARAGGGLATTALALLLGGLALAPLAAAHPPAAWSGRMLLLAAYLGLVCTAAAYALFVRALADLSAGVALGILLLQALAALPLGAWLLGEPIDTPLLASAAALGCALAARALPPSLLFAKGSAHAR